MMLSKADDNILRFEALDDNPVPAVDADTTTAAAVVTVLLFVAEKGKGAKLLLDTLELGKSEKGSIVDVFPFPPACTISFPGDGNSKDNKLSLLSAAGIALLLKLKLIFPDSSCRLWIVLTVIFVAGVVSR